MKLSNDKTALLKVTDSDIQDGTFSIPDSVTTIGESAFKGCTGLTHITLPNSVTTIGEFAFSGCSGLARITLPNSLTRLGDGVFQNCAGLTHITLPNSVTRIGSFAFHGCSGLARITLPNSLTEIEIGAFTDCIALTHITLPNSLTEIEYGAFNNCTGLTHITLPKSLTEIVSEVFQGCTGLTHITLPESINTISLDAFQGCPLKWIIINTKDPDQINRIKALLPHELRDIVVSKDLAQAWKKIKAEALDQILRTPEINPLYRLQGKSTIPPSTPKEIFSLINAQSKDDNNYYQAAKRKILALALPTNEQELAGYKKNVSNIVEDFKKHIEELHTPDNGSHPTQQQRGPQS